MSLNFVDKGSDNRAAPTPNAPDLNTNRLAHGTTSINPRAQGTQASAGKVTTKGSLITVNNGTNDVAKLGLLDSSTYGFETSDGTNVRAFAGEHATLGQGFYVSAAGNDANTATGDNLIFNSNQNVFKIAAIVTGSITVSFGSHSSGASTWIDGADTSSTLTMAHNLGITPTLVPQIFNNLSSTYEPVSSQAVCDILNGGGLYIGPFSFGLSTWKIYADSTNVYVKATRSYAVTASGQSVASQSGSANFKIYCLQETAN